MTRRVTRVVVGGLFGYANHDVKFRVKEPTILTAPNGAGKTHVLSLLRAALSIDLSSLSELPYEQLRVWLDDDSELWVRRDVLLDQEASVMLRLATFRGGEPTGSELRVDSSTVEALASEIPSFIKPVGPNRWIDMRSGRAYDKLTLRRRFRVRDEYDDLLKPYPEIAAFRGNPYPVLIDTKRLDVGPEIHGPGDGPIGSSRAAAAAARINEYIARLRAEIEEARRESILATQSADVSFARRAIAAAKLTVNEAALHKRYDRTVETYETLAKNSLAVGEAPIPFPEKPSPTVKRILSLFLDDWDKRLEPLLPLNSKIQALRDVLDSKLAPSGKRSVVSQRGGLEFRTASGRRVPVTRLSSGEQHLIALFTMLLFSAQPGSLVLIDEPEISLHAAWQHAFLADITSVAAVSNLQIVLATHSTAIINGRWDLTEELELTPNPTGYASGDDDDLVVLDSDELDD